MPTERHRVEVQEDLIERLSKAHPVQALAELIWNGLDADATRVDVRLGYGALGLTRISIADNGHGIPRSEAKVLFTRLGGSWKRPGGKTQGNGRFLHGHEGRGRFKAFALGRVADWNVTYANGEGLRAYTVSIIESNLREVRIGEEKTIDAGTTGVELVISEPHKDFTSLNPENSSQELAEIFALYLKDYGDVRIGVDGHAIDPAGAIATTAEFALDPIEIDGEIHDVGLEIIEWRASAKRALYLCNEQGFPLSQVSTRFHVGDFHFSAYLKSSFVSKLHNEAVLDLAEMNPALMASIEEAQGKIKEYFRDRAAERSLSRVEAWKEEKVYPYEGEPASPIEQVERKVFDIVASKASDYMPDFDSAPHKNKALHLRMLRTAIEKSPNELQLILNEVLNLPKREQAELANLLQETSLSAIISAAKTVADRLKKLNAFETIVFDPEMKTRLKERSQLHQMLADNTWVFGEEFALSVSDKSLTEVLRKHKKMLGEGTVIDKPIRLISKQRGIVDLMFSRALRNHRADALEHLIVELKAPRVKLTAKDVTQIEEYAFAVANDERFRNLSTSWTFWLISNDMDEYVGRRTRGANLPRGVIYQAGDQPITIWVKTWAQVFDENKARLQFFQEKLEYQVDQGRALKHLQERYREFLEGVITESVSEKTESDDAA